MRCATGCRRTWKPSPTKYFDHALEAHVTFSRARSFFTCDINLHAGRGLRLRGEGEAADANTAFDDAAEHIAKRLRRYRRRVNEHARDLANRERPEAARQFMLQEETERQPRPPTARQAARLAERICHGDRRDPTEITTAVGGRGGDADGPRRPAGDDVPQQRKRRSERGVSAQRRQHRLDRSRALRRLDKAA